MNINEYLSQEAYFNPYEDRYISRNSLVRLLADKDASHFDPDEDLYTKWLNESMMTQGKLKLSQKELFMWDIYSLCDWHINKIKQDLEFDELLKKHGTSFELMNYQIKKKKELANYFNSFLHGSVSMFTSRGAKLCEMCHGKLHKVSAVKFECKSCGYIKEL